MTRLAAIHANTFVFDMDGILLNDQHEMSGLGRYWLRRP